MMVSQDLTPIDELIEACADECVANELHAATLISFTFNAAFADEAIVDWKPNDVYDEPIPYFDARYANI